MAEQQWNAFEFYSQASKRWTDAFSSWTKAAEGFPGAFKGADMSAWFGPFWSQAEDWGKVYGNMANMLKTLPFPYSVMKDMGDATAKTFGSYVKVYDAWFKSMDSLTREAYEMSLRVTRGEKPQTRPFFDTIRDSYGNVSSAILESLKTASIDGSREMHEAVRNTVDSLSEEQKMTAKLVEEMLHYNAEAATLSRSAMERTTEAMAEMFEKGEISDDNYQAILDAWGEAIKHSCEVLRLPVSVAPGYEGIIDDATNWSKANLKLCISWLEANLKLYSGMTKSPAGAYKAWGEVFKDARTTSPEDLYQKWSEAWKKAAEITADNSQLKESMPKIINAYADWNRAANQFYRTLTTSPYPTRAELNELSDEIEKLKKTLEKERKTRSRAEGVRTEESY